MAMKLAVDVEDNQPVMVMEIAVNHAENNPPEFPPAIKCGAMNSNHGFQGSRIVQDSLENQGILNELRQQGCSSH